MSVGGRVGTEVRVVRVCQWGGGVEERGEGEWGVAAACCCCVSKFSN